MAPKAGPGKRVDWRCSGLEKKMEWIGLDWSREGGNRKNNIKPLKLTSGNLNGLDYLKTTNQPIQGTPLCLEVIKTD